MLADIGSALSGAGALASGFGLGGGSSPSVDYRGAKKGIRWRVRDAKKAGIHPLYAMGAPGIGSGILSGGSGSDPGAGIQGAGQALSQFAQARTQKAFNEANLKKIEAETQYVEEQIAASQQSRMSQGAVTSPARIPPEIYPSHVKVQNRDGSWSWQSNPDLASDVSEVIGPYVDRALNWEPNLPDLYEFVLGPWERLIKRNLK